MKPRLDTNQHENGARKSDRKLTCQTDDEIESNQHQPLHVV